ncbi:hypothetical protein Tco_0158880 [Tanacetum coccineum]
MKLTFNPDVGQLIRPPVSAEALAILPETSTEPSVMALITTDLSTVVIHPNYDPFLLVKDYENPDLAGVVPDVILGPERSSFPLRSFSLYDPFPSASVTSYGPSHLGPSFPVSSARLLRLRYTKSPGLKNLVYFRTWHCKVFFQLSLALCTSVMGRFALAFLLVALSFRSVSPSGKGPAMSIPLVCIQEAFEGESAQGFDLSVYFWQRVTVLGIHCLGL